MVKTPAKKAAGSKAGTRRVASARRKPASRTRASRPAKRARSPRPARSAKAGIGLINQHMDYTSHAMDDVRRFYTDLLGFGDFRYDSGVEYLYVRTGASSSVGFMPPRPGPPEQWRPPREPAIYLEVRDVDRAHRDLVGRGVSFQQPPTDMPWNQRVAVLRDPEGRTIMLAQKLATERARTGRRR